MFGKLGILAICAVLTLPSFALAQEQTDEADATTAESDAGGLSLGQPDEAGEVQVGQTYGKGVYGDWELRCVKSGGEKDPCQLYQLLNDQGGNAVAEFTIFDLPEGGQAEAGATVITPLETLLTAELRLSVDGGQARRYPYSFCTEIGCFARIGFTAPEVESFRKGASATIVIVPAASPNETVILSVSLSGFTAGWNAVVAENAAPAE